MTLWRMLAVGGIATILLSGAGEAQSDDIPPFDICFGETIDVFEAQRGALGAVFAEPLAGLETPAVEAALAPVTTRQLRYCAQLAITICDRSDAQLPCQVALQAEWRDLRTAILSDLPPPEETVSDWSGRLYANVWGLIHGSSAGPDCAGSGEVYATWCDAWQSALKLEEVVMAWQIARLRGTVEAEPRPDATLQD